MITLIQQTKVNKTLLGRVRRYSEKILAFLSLQEKIVTVVFCDKNFIAELNKKYFNKDYTTNVISFPFNEKEYLGEIYVCLSVAEEEALEWGVSLFYEIMYLIIHGMLHLIGYDHVGGESEAAVMEKKEAEIIESIGLKKWRAKYDS